jgi:nitrile hydratase subunit alpha
MTSRDHVHGDHGNNEREPQHNVAHGRTKDHDAAPMSAYEILEEAVRGLLIEKGVLTDEEINHQIDIMDSRSPALGAKVIARAWTDPRFKKHLLLDTRAALAEFGVDIGTLAEYRTVENTAEIHNVVVCTLCSCYPKMLLGIPPAWYKSRAYRSRVVADPRGVLREFGVDIPNGVKIRVHDSTADLRYIALPQQPTGTEDWTEEQLASIVTRDCMIGTALPRASTR